MCSGFLAGLGVQNWTYILVGITFTIYIGISIWARAGSTKEFYVAGGGVSPLANGMATAADWMSAASFISMAGIISFAGYDGAVYLMGWTGGYVLLALLLAPYLRKFGKFTVPDFIGDRYYSNTARSVGVFCALIVSFTYVAGQMRGVGLVFFAFFRGRYQYRCYYWNDNRFILCRFRRNERYYIYASRSILCTYFCFYGSGNIYIDSNDGESYSAIRFW
ncbi:acetate permease ActP [Algibacter lectus]|uniref:Acetate permease ActP n=1 Tax=Algibacter lectus TaxID=221126 RepID=A0A090VK02_9FLAO|nr:acetate permease ActP [Algibacter lectus]